MAEIQGVYNSINPQEQWKLGNCIYKYTYRKDRCLVIENPSILFLPCKKEENTSLFQKLEKTQQTCDTVMTSMPHAARIYELTTTAY